MTTLFKPHQATLSIILVMLFFIVAPSTIANPSWPPTHKTDKEITTLYHNLQQQKNINSLAARITFISSEWLGRPYYLNTLGEGDDAEFDQAPLYRSDAFDCETYVDMVLAAALATDLKTFKQCIRNVRYLNGEVSFITRNHFTALDWNINNQNKGYTKDITTSFHDENNQPVALQASALIDKPSWYQHLAITRVRLRNENPALQAQKLDALKEKGQTLSKTNAQIYYLPLTALFTTNGSPNNYLFNQIPSGAIIEIVRPNWDLTKEIGTHINVSHLGFAIRDHSGVLMFREASTVHKKVTDVPLIDYLRQAIKSPTIKGINVHIIQNVSCD